MTIQNAPRSIRLVLLIIGISFTHSVELGGDCTNLACAKANSECITNVCTCESGYTEEDGECLRSLGSEGCNNAADCVSNSNCDGNPIMCNCKPGYGAKEELCSKIIGTECTTSNEDAVCALDNTECENGFCACMAGYQGEVTCSKVIGTECTTSNEDAVCALDNTECENGFCACMAGYQGEVTCSKVIGGNCNPDSTCPGDPNAECKNNECVCKTDYAEKGDVCTQIVSSIDCSTITTACDSIDNAVCDTETERCKCNPDFTMNIDKCDPKNAAMMVGFYAISLVMSILTTCVMTF